jgi:hypothetical protein
VVGVVALQCGEEGREVVLRLVAQDIAGVVDRVEAPSRSPWSERSTTDRSNVSGTSLLRRSATVLMARKRDAAGGTDTGALPT